MTTRYEHRGDKVHMLMGRGETHVVATCFNSSWAEVIAGLLQADWDDSRTQLRRKQVRETFKR